MLLIVKSKLSVFFISSRRRHTRCALVTGVQTCALPIWADGDVLMRFTGRIEKRHDGRIEPEQTAVLGTIANLAMPDPSAGDGLPHLLEKRLGVMAGVEHAVAAADYRRSAVTGAHAKRVEPVRARCGERGGQSVRV